MGTWCGFQITVLLNFGVTPPSKNIQWTARRGLGSTKGTAHSTQVDWRNPEIRGNDFLRDHGLDVAVVLLEPSIPILGIQHEQRVLAFRFLPV